MINKVYALTTTRCNLSCPHCDVKNQKESFNQSKFIHTLEDFEGDIFLLGGEITMYQDRMFAVGYNEKIRPKIKGITSNLIILNDDLIKYYQEVGHNHVGTSWNPYRFNDDEYQTWLKHLGIISDHGINSAILITLDQDLLRIHPRNIIEMIRSWSQFKCIKSIRFENVVANYVTKEWFEQADDYLCELYKRWDFDIILENVSQVANNLFYMCQGTYTLYPDGTLKHGCMHEQHLHVLDDCYNCEHAAHCRPCQLQPYCSYPKKFSEMVRSKLGVKDSGIVYTPC